MGSPSPLPSPHRGEETGVKISIGELSKKFGDRVNIVYRGSVSGDEARMVRLLSGRVLRLRSGQVAHHKSVFGFRISDFGCSPSPSYGFCFAQPYGFHFVQSPRRGEGIGILITPPERGRLSLDRSKDGWMEWVGLPQCRASSTTTVSFPSAERESVIKS
jgi:hypothetical protein